MPLSRSQRRQRRLEDEVQRQRDRLESEHTVAPCDRHPGWLVTLSKGRLAPPAHTCPYCVREELRTRVEPTPDTRVIDAGDVGTQLKPGQWDVVQDALEKNPRHREIDKLEEAEILEEIAAAREDEMGRDEPYLQQRPVQRIFVDAYGERVAADGRFLPVAVKR